MILELEVKNLAILEDVRVQFGPGLNVFTGETGAGKSLLMDALQFLLGRESFPGALVQGSFLPAPAAAALLEKDGFDPEDGLYLLRETRAGNKGACRLNGTLVPLAKMKQLASCLIEIQGQDGHRELLETRRAIFLLDAFAGEEPRRLREEIGKLFESRETLRKQRASLRQKEAERERQTDRCRYEIREIEEARLQEGEDEFLRMERERLTQLDRLYQVHGELSSLVDGVNFPRVAALLEKLSPYEKKLEFWLSRTQEIGYEWVEFKEILTASRERFLPDSVALERVVERLDLLHRLQKKHGPSLSEVFRTLEERKRELEGLSSLDQDLASLERNLQEVESSLEDLARDLSALRKEHAESLSRAVEKELPLLGLPDGKFQVKVEPLEEITPLGKDRVEFWVSLNPGECLLRLDKAASGGELSRLMLALKATLASEEVPTLIFDEIDAGLGGEAAFHVAERLKSLSRTRQVLCVTHLHQVAALADHHFSLEKQVEGGKTAVRLNRLDREAKVRELARMMAGKRATQTALLHASELLARSGPVKSKKRWKSP